MIGRGYSLSLLHSYYSLAYLSQQKLAVVSELLLDAYKQEIKQKVWDLYTTDYLLVHFVEGQRLESFDDYFERLVTATKTDQVTATNDEYEEILKRAEASKNKHLKAIRKQGDHGTI